VSEVYLVLFCEKYAFESLLGEPIPSPINNFRREISQLRMGIFSAVRHCMIDISYLTATVGQLGQV
jgi:hypothetical protein